MSEQRDARPVIESMAQMLKLFEAGSESLNDLSQSLRSAIASLGGVVDENWLTELEALRNEVELVNAFQLRAPEQPLQAGDELALGAAISEIKRLLSLALGDHSVLRTDDTVSFELFKAFPPDRDSPVVELNARTDATVEIPAEIRREAGQLRIAIFGRQGGVAWDYPLEEWMDALARAAEVLGD